MSHIPFAVKKYFEIENIYSVYYFNINQDFIEEPEHHDFWELIYADSGKIYVCADDETIYLREGDVFIHKPNQKHSLRGDNQNSSRIFITSFECHSPEMLFFVNKLFRANEQDRSLIHSIISAAKSTFEWIENKPEIHPLVKLKNAFPGNMQVLSNTIELLLLDIYSQKQSQIIRPFLFKELYDDPIIISVIDFLDNSIFSEFTTADVAKKLNFSVSYLSSYFKNQTHYSITEYFNMLKLEKAKILLKEANKSIAEVSRELNYCDQHYFSTVFKKYMKMTPMEYKKTVLKSR